MKKSAGVLVYKIEDSKIMVLLCHFGGPYWEKKDKGAWSIAKGEVLAGEKVWSAAVREFKEETNLDIYTDLDFLATKKISNKKLAVMFYTKADFDLSKCKSNDFELLLPNGVVGTFPEMDKYQWMELKVAKEMIVSNQLYFLEKLEEKLK